MSIVEKIKSLHVNPYVNILITGDNSKTLYMPLWGLSSKIPHVYTRRIFQDKDTIHCALWDVPGNTNNTNRMFFSDDLSYCIIMYDLPYRRVQPQQITLPSIVEYIHQVKVYSKLPLEIIVVIIKDEMTRTEEYETTKEYCTNINIPPIIVDRKNLSKIKDLPETLSIRVYQQRKKTIAEEIKAILHLQV